MKTIAFALLLVASASAYSQVSVAELNLNNGTPRIADTIIQAIENLKERIREAGLDPYELELLYGEYAFILPTVFSASGKIEDFKFNGLSNIIVHDIGYSLITNRLSFNVELPQIAALIGNIAGEVTIAGRNLDAELSGSISVHGFALVGAATVTLDDEYGAIFSDVELESALRAIDSNLNIRFLSIDLSVFVNEFLQYLPANLSIYDDLINRGLARIVQGVLNRFL